MAKFFIAPNSTSVILKVFIQDSSAENGDGLAGLIHTSSIAGGYCKKDGTGVAVAVDEDVDTEGTYQAPSSVAHIRIGTPANMLDGDYELHLHNDQISSTDWTTISLGGASDMAPLKIEIQLGYINSNITHIMGTVLTETAGGRLAAAFIKLFDVVTPLLVASDVMRGTELAALASVCTEVRIAELAVANLPTDIAAIKAETVLIVEDTNEIQGKLPATLIADGTELAAVKAETATIKSDTVATKSDTTNILTDTNEIQGKLPAGTIADQTDTTDIINDVAAVKAETVLIVEDTNEIQGKLPATLIADGTELAAVKTEVDLTIAGVTLVLEDTNEIQGKLPATDIADGTELAAVKAETVLIVEDTNEIQGKLPATDIAGQGGASDTLATLSDQIDGISAGVSPTLLEDTTISSITSQVEFVIADGSNVDNAYLNQAVVFYDISNSDYSSPEHVCTNYVGVTRTMTVDTAPNFTIANGQADKVKVFQTAPGTTAPTSAENRIEMDSNSTQLALIVEDTNEIQGKLPATDIADGTELAAVKTEVDLTKTDTTAIISDVAAVKAETVLIVEDTDEIQGKLPATLISDGTELAAVKAETVLIVEDTNQIQGVTPGTVISTQVDVQALQNNTRYRISVPSFIQIPYSSNIMVPISIYFLDDDGLPFDPDSSEVAIQVRAVNQQAYKTFMYNDEPGSTPASLNGTFSPSYYTIIKLGTGEYQTYFKIPSTETVDTLQLKFKFKEATNEITLPVQTNLVKQVDLVTLDDSSANRQVVGKAMKVENISESEVSGSIYKDIKDDTAAVVAKLPSGDISDYSLATTVDGRTIEYMNELILSMFTGRYRKDFPSAGQLTIYKQNNSTVLAVVAITPTERTRITPA